MLSASRYLLGVVEIGLVVGFAWLGASAARRHLLPGWSGMPAWLGSLVLGSALVLIVAEVLGTFGLFEPLPYLVGVAVAGCGAWAVARRLDSGESGIGPPAPGQIRAVILVALGFALIAIAEFASGVRLRLDTGMTGFDSTWYHAPFAAGFFQTGDTRDLHFIAPQFLAWFYPANAEVFHAIGMNAFDRDLISPLLNLGWFTGCLAAAWCIGRPYGQGLLSLLMAALALGVSALADQAGEARSDIAGIFFLLAAAAIAVNAAAARGGHERGLPTGALIVIGLAAGLAAGTKLNFLLPSAVLVIGLVAVAPAGRRIGALAALGLPALLGGSYWYLRNLLQTGNPLPWFDHVGPLSLPAPDQELGGREAHSVLSYLGDGAVWSDWFLPGFRDGLGFLWPLLVAVALIGLVLCLSRRADPVIRVFAAVGLAAAVAWFIAPTSASGPEGMPRGFESGLRYLAPALVLGMSLFAISPVLRKWAKGLDEPAPAWRPLSSRLWGALGCVAVLLVVGVGYVVQRDYLRDRYASPDFTTPGLNATFEWARSVSGARIATTSTRQYPLLGTDLSNRVEFVGIQRPHGGFVAPESCHAWVRALNEGDYDYVVASRDRIEPNKPPYPPTVRWTEGPSATVVLRKPPTVVFKLKGPVDPSTCPRTK